MAGTIHVSGTSTVTVDGAELGVSVNGVTIKNHNQFQDVFTDELGPLIPTDVQNMGFFSTVEVELIKYDNDVLSNCIGPFAGVGEGDIGQVGALLIQQQGSHELGIQVENITGGEDNFTFPTAYVIGVTSWNVGVVRTVVKLEFRCLGFSDTQVYE